MFKRAAAVSTQFVAPKDENLELMAAVQKSGGFANYLQENRAPGSQMKAFANAVGQQLFDCDVYEEAVKSCRPSCNAATLGISRDALNTALNKVYKQCYYQRFFGKQMAQTTTQPGSMNLTCGMV